MLGLFSKNKDMITSQATGFNAQKKVTFAALATAMVMSLSATSAMAQGEQGFHDYLNTVGQKAIAQGVKPSTISNTLPYLQFDETVAKYDRQYAPTPIDQAIPPYTPYKNKHITSTKVNEGRAVYRAWLPKLQQIEAETGVPAEMMVAIFGKETNYGSFTGSFDLPNSLATLAYEGRRRELFEGELIAVLKLMDQGISRNVLQGSFAGAFGYPQFLPSVYLRLATDGDGDGRAEIWNNRADAFASIANYFVNAGWRKGVPWGFAVAVPGELDRNAIRSNIEPPRCKRVYNRHSKWMTIREWKALGVIPQNGQWPNDDIFATLLEPDGQGATAYLLTSNYRAILDYNCSNFYALTVGLLANDIKN